jgi:hypothetical protein
MSPRTTSQQTMIHHRSSIIESSGTTSQQTPIHHRSSIIESNGMGINGMAAAVTTQPHNLIDPNQLSIINHRIQWHGHVPSLSYPGVSPK